jgi:hypothetical protein
MLVTAEATPNAPGRGYDLVFRVGDDHYLYRAGATGNTQLVDDDFAFAENAKAWHEFEATFTEAPVGTPGDYNADGHVDESDRSVWRASYGSWSLTTALPADGNRDGVVDTADYVLWRKAAAATATSAALMPSFGSSAPAAALSIALESIDPSVTLSVGSSFGRRGTFEPPTRSRFAEPRIAHTRLGQDAIGPITDDQAALLAIVLVSEDEAPPSDLSYMQAGPDVDYVSADLHAVDEVFDALVMGIGGVI